MRENITRRRMLELMGMGATAATLAACGNSLGTTEPSVSLPRPSGSAGGGAASGRTVRVGLIVPQGGVYAPLGVDMANGWKLWLAEHDGSIGGFKVETVTADEGDGPETGVPALQSLLQKSDVIVGVVNSAVALGTRNAITEAKKILIVANAGAGDITAGSLSPYIWRTSFTNAQVAAAMGKHLAGEKLGAVFVIAPDYAAGAEAVAGFRQTFEAGGGRIAGEAKPPFQKTQDYQPFLTQIKSSGAAACFCFFAGAEAVSFVRQYREFGVADSIPLFGSGFLTEGGVLTAQGKAAVGIKTSLHYSTELTNERNAAFVKAYRAANNQTPPTVYSMQAYDAAEVLNTALKASGDFGGDALSAALGKVGEVTTSPRGPWSFERQNPRQKLYLREVRAVGDAHVNAVIGELGTFGQT